MIRVVIVGAIRLYREGIALILDRDTRVQAVAQLADASQAVGVASDLQPDVILLDAAGGDSVATVHAIKQADPQARVVVLGASEEEDEVIAYAEAGVAGYVIRDAGGESLCETIVAVAGGGTLCSPIVTATLLRRVAALAADASPKPTRARLTMREREIVELIEQRYSNKEIGRTLFIETATVKNHVHHILEKLEVHSRADIAAALELDRSVRTWRSDLVRR